MNPLKGGVVLLLLGFFTLLPGRAHAEWPEKPVRILVSYPAGGANDQVARVVDGKTVNAGSIRA